MTSRSTVQPPSFDISLNGEQAMIAVEFFFPVLELRPILFGEGNFHALHHLGQLFEMDLARRGISAMATPLGVYGGGALLFSTDAPAPMLTALEEIVGRSTLCAGLVISYYDPREEVWRKHRGTLPSELAAMTPDNFSNYLKECMGLLESRRELWKSVSKYWLSNG